MASSGPGPVAVVHRITIVVALLGALAYAAWELHGAVTDGDALAGMRAGIALIVSLGIGVYLRNLRGRLDAKLTPRA